MSTRVGAFGSGGEGYTTKVLARFIPAHCNRDILAKYPPPVPLRLFDYDPVRPFDQRYKNRRIAKFCTPIFQVCFRDPTGPGTGTSSKDRNVFGYDFVQHFGKRRPTHREYD